LPALVRAWAPQQAQVGAVGGKLYAANTTGAIIGALITSFMLIPALGLRGSALAAAGLNLAIAALAILFERYAGRELPERKVAVAGVMPKASGISVVTPAVVTQSQVRRARWLYAIAGGVALGYEVVWSQSIVQFMSTRSFAFSVVLATYLLGLVIGSALYARFADRVRDPWAVFGLLIAGAGVLAMLEFAGLGMWLLALQKQAATWVSSVTDNQLAVMCARFAVAALSVVFAPTLLLGAAFPAALRLSVQAGQVGRDVGTVLALNTAGGIVGSMLAGFVLVPWLGLVHSLGVLAVVAALLGLAAVLPGFSPVGGRQLLRFAVILLALIAGAFAVMTPANRFGNLLAEARGGRLGFYEESRGGTVAVVTQGASGGEFNRLYIQGVSNSGDAMTSLRYMRLQALLPLIIHNGEPRSALVIGFGTGITAGALLSYPTLEKRVVAELLPAVLRAAPRFDGNQGVASDSRMDIRLRDGRRELLRSDEHYDLITLEPPPPSAAGVVNLYSRDFYALAAARMNDKGIVAQWLPLPTQNDEDTRALVRSFLDVFPHASLWSTELHEMLLVGSREPLELDAQRIAERFNQPEMKTALSAVGVATPAALLATWVMDRAALERYAGNAPAVTDDQPRIEYASWVRSGEFGRVLPKLYALRTDAPLRNAPAGLVEDVARERDRMLTFYEAGLYAYAGDRESWSKAMAYVMEREGSNPYYRWMAGSSEER
jgi:spermidine synthase